MMDKKTTKIRTTLLSLFLLFPILSFAQLTSGTYTIGAAGNYATVALFNDAIQAGTTLDGNLTGEHLDEETAITGEVAFDIDTNGNLFTLTAQSGAEHDGSAYGNGARINFGTFDEIAFDETSAGDFANLVISNLAIDVSGGGNQGILVEDCGTTLVIVNRCLIVGDANTIDGIKVLYNSINVRVTNNIIYGIGNGGEDSGITIDSEFGPSGTWSFYNNTVAKCFTGIHETSGTPNGTINLRNNLCQGNTTDYVDASGSGFSGTISKNISEDTTSPDVAYRSVNAHDATSSFENYAGDDYRLAGGGTDDGTIDDGDNLYGSGVTEDIAGQARDDGTPFWIGASHIPAAPVGGAQPFYQIIQNEKIKKEIFFYCSYKMIRAENLIL